VAQTAQETPFKILLVEDNPGDVELTRAALAEMNVPIDLSVAIDGMAAIELLTERKGWEDSGRPDLILLDINLPRKSGLEVLEVIKTSPALHDIPVLMLSCSGAEGDISKSYDLYANCYVKKPDNLDGFDKIFSAIGGFWMGVVELPPK
jgi:two-component system, chemotaxis family, response regulator Rcp1